MEPMSSDKNKARWRECEGINGEAMVYAVWERISGGRPERMFRLLDGVNLVSVEAGVDWSVEEKPAGTLRLVARVPEPRCKYTAATFHFQGDEPPTHVFVFPSVEAMMQHLRRVKCPKVEDYKYSYAPESELEALRRAPSLRTFVHPQVPLLELDSEREVETPVPGVAASRHVVRRPGLAVMESDSDESSFLSDFMEVDRSPPNLLTSGSDSGGDAPLVVSQPRVLRKSRNIFRSLAAGRRRLLSEASEPCVPAFLPSQEVRIRSPSPALQEEEPREETPPPEASEEPRRKRQVGRLLSALVFHSPRCSRVQRPPRRCARLRAASTSACASRGARSEDVCPPGSLSGAKLSPALSLIAGK